MANAAVASITHERTAEFWAAYDVIDAPYNSPARFAAYAIRHQRYVVETQWERGQFGFELDQADTISAVGLLVDTRPDDPVPLGTVRLIAAARPDSREVSRFCVARGAPPLAPLALIAWAWAASERRHVTHWTAVATPGLLAWLDARGLTFDRQGEAVERHGRRFEVETSIASMFTRCWQRCPDVHAFLDHGRRIISGGTK